MSRFFLFNIWIIIRNILILLNQLTIFNCLNFKKMLRQKENIDFAIGSAATIVRCERSLVVCNEYGVIPPPYES